MGELWFLLQIRPYNLPVLKSGVYIGVGMREGGEEVIVGVLLNRDIMFMGKVEVADGVVVVLVVLVVEEAGGVGGA